jgi:uncharacterized small protein (DUF1192 family)
MQVNDRLPTVEQLSVLSISYLESLVQRCRDEIARRSQSAVTTHDIEAGLRGHFVAFRRKKEQESKVRPESLFRV